MTRTVEEARAAAGDWYRSRCPGGPGHEYDPKDEGTRWQKGDCHGCIIDALSAVPAHDDKGAEAVCPACEATAKRVGPVKCESCGAVTYGEAALAVADEWFKKGRAASSSGEATALREAAKRVLVRHRDVVDGTPCGCDDCRILRRALAAPSQETETRGSAPELAACANPYHAKSGCFGRENECYDIRAAIAPAGPRDPASLCGRCVHETTPTSTPGVWVCSYNDARVGNVYSCVGFRPAPAPSAAPDTGSERYCNMCGAVYSGPPEHANESGCQYMAPTLAEIAARASPGAGGADEGSAT
jgi:hypothetical protein